MTAQVLGARFFTGTQQEAVARAMEGGLVVAPSGPGLAVDLLRSQHYRDALVAADLVLIDSSALVLAWGLRSGEWLPRISGLMFIRAVLQQPALREPGALFWVMPSVEEARRNFDWLATQGFQHSPEDCYIAPHYPPGPLADRELLQKIESRRPRLVVLAIGGGVQERLGHFLSAHLSYRPGVLCIGAAIAFLTGGQVRIPHWADTFMIAWLLRVLYSPTRYFRRYWEARMLFPLVWKYRDTMPPLQG
jgi:UDP-N-acetyl-D-mannosaminuronic acid transferase (WecB/TagA/CpsF family)